MLYCQTCQVYDYNDGAEYSKVFLRTLMQSKRVSISTEHAKTLKSLILDLLRNSITITEFLQKVKIELDCRNFSQMLHKSLEISLPVIREEIDRHCNYDECISISDTGEIMISQRWAAELNRYKVQEEIAKLIENINFLFGHVEPKVSVETVAFEWEDKIFGQSQGNELKYKAEMVTLMAKLRGNT